MGRPLAALLANDGARVFSVDIDSIQEYTKRPGPSADDNAPGRRYHPHHVVRSCAKSLEECLALSDVVISAVPNASYKVPTASLKDGCICVNVASEKNFEKDVREKVRGCIALEWPHGVMLREIGLLAKDTDEIELTGFHLLALGREGNHTHAAAEFVSDAIHH